MVGGGLTLLGLFGVLAAISPRFAYGRDTLDKPILELVVLLMLAGAVYLFTLWRARPWNAGAMNRLAWLGVIGVGLAMRLILFSATPILEDDFYRYLWDGAVVAEGLDPYAVSPRDALGGLAPEPLRSLLDQAPAAETVLARVNHPHLRTIYPPTAQLAFAAAHLIAPWDVLGLRVVWLACDLLTLGLIVHLLKRLALPLGGLVIYWWNPLLVQQVYASLHMDVLLAPLLLTSLAMLLRARRASASLALAFATAAKLWPALLMILPLRQDWPRPRRLVAASLAFALPAAALLTPVAISGLGQNSGFITYGRIWQMNDSIFLGLYESARLITENHAQTLARAATGAMLALWCAWLCRRPASSGRQLVERALWIVTALFLLSPTQFPWYWIWIAPLLAVSPSPGQLVLTATLPLYYLRFRFEAMGLVGWFDYGVVWLEFLPAWILIVWEWRRRASRSSPWRQTPAARVSDGVSPPR